MSTIHRLRVTTPLMSTCYVGSIFSEELEGRAYVFATVALPGSEGPRASGQRSVELIRKTCIVFYGVGTGTSRWKVHVCKVHVCKVHVCKVHVCKVHVRWHGRHCAREKGLGMKLNVSNARSLHQSSVLVHHQRRWTPYVLDRIGVAETWPSGCFIICADERVSCACLFPCQLPTKTRLASHTSRPSDGRPLKPQEFSRDTTS